MEIQALGENDFRVDPAETVLDTDPLPFAAGILTDGFESHRTVLVDPVGPFLSDDGAFQIAGTDGPVMVGIHQNDLLREFFSAP